jgi:UDP-4-amino-4,6-dideoxy-N-acetyl-beta-L-altrosamine transaminase
MQIPYGRQNIDETDINAVVDVLRSEFLTQGPAVPMFEGIVSDYCGSEYAVAVSSATAALHLACLALDVGPGDLVWTSAITFVASANCARYCDADVDFIDIDPQTYNMSVLDLERKLEIAQKSGRLPKVVIPVHLAGQACDMKKIFDLAKRYGFKIIEDASHAIGGSYEGVRIGSCQYSDITIFSFHPVKIITTGEGGMAVTNDGLIAGRLSRLRSHGITRALDEIENKPDGPWYYEQLELGYNYRMNDIQAALGLSQMTKLDQFVIERKHITDRYNEMFLSKPIKIPFTLEMAISSCHLYVARLDLVSLQASLKQVFDRMRSAGILVNLHYIPVYRHPYYEKIGYERRDYPVAEAYYSNAISLPIFPGLTSQQQEFVVKTLCTPTGNQVIF